MEGAVSIENELKWPPGFQFADLQITMDPVTKEIRCELEPLLDLLQFNGVHARLFRDRPYFQTLCFSTILECGYRSHRARCGDAHPVLEGVLSQVSA